MKLSLSIICILILSIVSFGCATHEQKLIDSKAKYYDQNDLEMLFAQKHVAEFSTPRGTTGTITYYPDRKMHVRYGDKEDNGEYRFKDGQFCSTWQNIRKGEKCSKLYEVRDNVFEIVTPTGVYDSKVTFIE